MAGSVPLYYVWDYTDVDRAFWAEHLEDWLPKRLIDAHTHVTDPAFRREPMTPEMRRQYWVSEATDVLDAPTAQKCIETVWPGRDVTCIALGSPSLAFDIEASNEDLRLQCLKRGWRALSVMLPQWSAERVDEELAKPGVLGLKPYYQLIGADPLTRDRYLEAGIFEFLPHHALEVANARRAWVTLHVPKADRLPHPDNIREVKEIRRRYPDIVLVIAHLGRCYTEAHALEGLPPLADVEGLYFDISAVLNPAVLRIAFDRLGPEKILFGTDNPVFYMRGRRQWRGRQYINRTNKDFFFNKEHEAAEVETRYTLYMYEALRAIKDVSAELGMGRKEIEAIFYGNARSLIDSVLAAKAGG